MLGKVVQKKITVKWGYLEGGGPETLICQNANYPPPPILNIFGGFLHMLACKPPSDPKTGWDDPISGEMMLCGCLNPFLAISKFFDFYHALASSGKLGDTPKLALFLILPPQLHFWGSQNWVEKWL